jgi:hypothetical protein
LAADLSGFAEMTQNVRKWRGGDETDICGARSRDGGFGLELLAGFVEIDFL